jgi:hypothetical protein
MKKSRRKERRGRKRNMRQIKLKGVDYVGSGN